VIKTTENKLKKRKIKSLLPNMFIIFVSILFFFISGEIFFRAIFPEWRNHIFTSDATLGKRYYWTLIRDLAIHSRDPNFDINLIGNFSIRFRGPNFDTNLKPGDHIVLVLGDSVTAGYGHAYEDIFWSNWQRMLDLEGGGQNKNTLHCWGGK